MEGGLHKANLFENGQRVFYIHMYKLTPFSKVQDVFRNLAVDVKMK